MKMTKRILTAAAAVAMVIGFTSCEFLSNNSLSKVFHKKFGESSMLAYTDATADAECGKWTISGENTNTKDYKRGLDLLSTKHSDMSGIVEISAENPNGVVGLVFDASKKTIEVDDPENEGEKKDVDLYSFGVVGIRLYNNVPQYYISYFANITEESFNKTNMGANDGTKNITKTSVDPETETPYEIVVKGFTPITNGSALKDEKGNIKVAIEVKEDDKTGDYDIGLYDMTQLKNDSSLKEDAASCGSAKILAEKTLKKDGPAQAMVGAYANVYHGAGEDKDPVKLNGSLTIFDFTNAANVAE